MRGYEHLGAGRHTSFQKVLGGNLIGRSILDVGCALGDLLFSAERLGSRRLVGIERNQERYLAADMIRDILRSEVEIHHCDFLDYRTDELFDHVFILNVLNHVFDFDRFLRKSAKFAKSTLTIEFPTLTDNKFREVYGLSINQMRPLNELPLIALRSKLADQSYVYSPVAVRNIVMNEIGGFSRCLITPSPLSDRVIAVFER